MPRKHENMNDLLLQAYRKGVESAIDLSIRTGVPLVVEKDGVIKKIKPQYKYIRVPIDFDESRLPHL